MATLYLTGYSNLKADKYGHILQASNFAGITEVQAITISGSSTQGAAFGIDTKWVEMHPDATCSVASGKNPTASASFQRYKADERVYVAVEPGQIIAVITNT